MAIATVTSKGQITIPKAVRDKLRLRAGDRVVFRVEADGTVRLFPVSKKVSEVYGFFGSKGERARSIAEMKQGVRKAFKDASR